MLFFCRDDRRVEIQCTVNGTAFAADTAPAPGARLRFSPHAAPVQGRQAAAGQDRPMRPACQFLVTDPRSGLDYAVQTSLPRDDSAAEVYLSFPDGLPPLDAELVVAVHDRRAAQDRLQPIDTGELNCFVRGAMIRTPSGEVPVETLLAGDMVVTKDNGAQTIRWIGSRSVDASGGMAPVCFAPGTCGNEAELRLSPRHRVLVQRDGRDVLVPAQDLVDGARVRIEEGGKVEYFHIIFDRHEVIFANGAPTESFHPLLDCAEPSAGDARSELFSLFPDMLYDRPDTEDFAYPVVDEEPLQMSLNWR